MSHTPAQFLSNPSYNLLVKRHRPQAFRWALELFVGLATVMHWLSLQ